LVILNMVQTWPRVGVSKDGRPYGPGLFKKDDLELGYWEAILQRGHNRKLTFRLLAWAHCLNCGAPMPEGSTGDHLIPLSEGGPAGAENYIPLDRVCNSSKGPRDFWAWWYYGQNKTLADVPHEILPDLLCAYARLRYHWLRARRELDLAAPNHILALIHSCQALMPARHWFTVLDEADRYECRAALAQNFAAFESTHPELRAHPTDGDTVASA
jgi:hypothetical protein